MVIKLYAFELDHVLWNGSLNILHPGTQPGPRNVAADNLRLSAGSNHIVEDRVTQKYVSVFSDVCRIFQHADQNDVQIAITSSNGNKEACDRVLWLIRVPDKHDSLQSMITFVKYDENGQESKLDMFTKLQEWSKIDYKEMLFFDLDCQESRQVEAVLGVNLKVITKYLGLTWCDYAEALRALDPAKLSDTLPRNMDLPPYTNMPALGRLLGKGNFGEVYRSAEDPTIVVKRLKYWKTELQRRFVTIYNIIDSGDPFEPDSSRNLDDEIFLSTIALELRNLRAVGALRAPLETTMFCGWFSLESVPGRPIWDNPLYKRHPFSVPFQSLLKRAFHLTVDQIEFYVRKGGMEHRDPHLANVQFRMDGDKLTTAHIFDWGFAVRMTWDGRRYTRANDTLAWNSGVADAVYTPQEFRRYWVEWMVKTEYEAQISRKAISLEDGTNFLKDLSWWSQRDDDR